MADPAVAAARPQVCGTRTTGVPVSAGSGPARRSGISTLRAGRFATRRRLARIKSLAIPPAWTDVWICPSPLGHIQATGRDEKGRKQYRYHPRWRIGSRETKYDRMIAFGRGPAANPQADGARPVAARAAQVQSARRRGPAARAFADPRGQRRVCPEQPLVTA